MFEYFKKLFGVKSYERGTWSTSFNGYTFYDENGNFVISIGNTCLESYPCQHYISLTQEDKTGETWFMPTIQKYLEDRKIPLRDFHSYH